jgi:hypothetical protein
MKNIKKIAAFGVIGVMVLLAVAGATLASGAGIASVNTAYEQTSKVQSMNNDANDQMHRIQNQFENGNGLMMQNGTALQAMVCTNQMNGICDGTQDKFMTQDQTRQMNRTCQSTMAYANLASSICDGTQDKLMTQDQTKLKDGSCQSTNICPKLSVV